MSMTSVLDLLPSRILHMKAPLPAIYEKAKVSLADCVKIDECKDWADKAEALASYAKQANDTALRNMADRIQARAIQRCGVLLKQIEQANGANQNIKEGALPKVAVRKHQEGTIQ